MPKEPQLECIVAQEVGGRSKSESLGNSLRSGCVTWVAHPSVVLFGANDWFHWCYLLVYVVDSSFLTLERTRTLLCTFFVAFYHELWPKEEGRSGQAVQWNYLRCYTVCYGFVGLVVFLPIVLYIYCCSHTWYFWEIYCLIWFDFCMYGGLGGLTGAPRVPDDWSTPHGLDKGGRVFTLPESG